MMFIDKPSIIVIVSNLLLFYRSLNLHCVMYTMCVLVSVMHLCHEGPSSSNVNTIIINIVIIIIIYTWRTA